MPEEDFHVGSGGMEVPEESSMSPLWTVRNRGTFKKSMEY